MDDPRTRLERERQETFDRLANLIADFDAIVAASRDSNADDEHDPEGSTIAFERSQLGALVEQARRHLTEIDAAVERLATLTYRTCERCGRPIPDERLRARPVARTCIACASATWHRAALARRGIAAQVTRTTIPTAGDGRR